MKKIVRIVLYVIIFLIIDFGVIIAFYADDPDAGKRILPVIAGFFGSKFITDFIVSKIYPNRSGDK